MTSRDRSSAGRIDAFRLARERGSVTGDIDPRRLSRVADVIGEGPGRIAWRIDGIVDASGRAGLTIALEGAVMLNCQRCLADFAWPVDQRSEVLLARDESQLAALDAESNWEVVLARGPIDPLTLVEDELVLALPFAPRHPDAACTSAETDRRT